MGRRPPNRTGSRPLTRRSALGLLVGGGLLSIGASGAFDTVQANRPFSLPVGSDNEGLLGIERHEPAVAAGQTATLIELTNRFGSTLETVDITVLSAGSLPLTTADLSYPDTLTPGESGVVEAVIDCGPPGVETVTLDIEATSSSHTVRASRTIRVRCLDSTAAVCDPHHLSPLQQYGCVRSTGFTLDSETEPCDTLVKGDGNVDITMRNAAEIGGWLHIQTGGETEMKIQNDSVVDGPLWVETDDEIDAVLNNDVEIDGPVRLETDDEIDLDIGNNVVVDGPVQATSDDEIDMRVRDAARVEGICLSTDDEIDLHLRNDCVVDGAISLESDDEIEIDLVNQATVEGPLDIETTDTVDVRLNGSTVDGDLTIFSADDVDLELQNQSTLGGNVLIETDGSISVGLQGSTIQGDLTLRSGDGSSITETGQSSIGGTVNETSQ